MSTLEPAGAPLARRIRRRGERIRRSELDTALSRVEACGELSASERAAVEELTERLADALVGPTATAIRECDDPETLTAARAVFGHGSRQ